MAEAFIDESKKNKEEIDALEVAESAREAEWTKPSFIGELFMGKLELSAVVPFPEQSPEDKRTGDEYLKKLEAFLEEHLDGDEVDRNGQIPDRVMKGLGELGAFGMKLPKKYGGLGLSQTNYNRALALVSRYCGSTAGTLSAHQSIGVPQPLLMFGTEEQQKKFVPMFAKGAVSAFALTEPKVGSDPAMMSTTAVLSEDGDHYILNGDKLWCTNGAIADVLVVMAKTPPKIVRGREKKQITAFIVEKNMPGFEVIHRCRFMGLNGIQNALLRFTDVKVPKENVIWGEGKGLKMALITLNTGRLSLPACCVGSGRECLTIAREWGNEREQWGAPVGKHEAGAAKLARMTANQLAMESVTWLTSAWADHKERDIRLEAAMAKYFTSVRSDVMVQELLQFRAGRGYETADSLKARGEEAIPVERMARDSRINQIVEGTNEIMHLFIAREALDAHLNVAGKVLNSRLGMGTRLAAAFKAGLFYLTWYPRQWFSLRFFPPAYSSLGPLARHMRYVKRASKRVARTLFHLMVVNGPGLEKKQRQLGRVVDIATDLFAMAATISRAAGRMPQSAIYGNIKDVADVFCLEARERIEGNFRAIRRNHDRAAYKVARKMLEGGMKWQEELDRFGGSGILPSSTTAGEPGLSAAYQPLSEKP